MGVIKPSFDTDRQVLGKILPVSTPFNVIIDSSEACNFRCRYCFRSGEDRSAWGYAKDGIKMDKQVFHKIVEQIMEFPQPVRQISLSNHGEPLTNRELPDMVRYIKQKGITSRVSIHTNAALLNEEYAMDLADSNIDRIVISLQGLSEVKYKEICGADIDFNRFYNNLSVLYKHKKDTQIYYKIMDTSLEEGEEEKFYRLFAPISDRMYIEREVPIWKNLRQDNGEDRTGGEILANKYGAGFPVQECCPLIFHTIVVSPIGDVYPCTQLLTPYVLGNISDHTLLELWNSLDRRELLLRQCRGQNPEICNGCYILQNSIYGKEDMIDAYRDEILNRLEK